MMPRKRLSRNSGGGGPWCGDLTVHSPEGEGNAFRAGRKVARRLSGNLQKKEGWAETMKESNNHSSGEAFKRVVVVVDHSQESSLALKWALSHVVQQLDVLTLLYVQPRPTSLQHVSHGSFSSAKASDELRRKNEVVGWELANSFKSLVSTCRPEVEVEILMVEGDKGPTIVFQTKRLQASILVLGQRKPSVLWRIIKKKHNDSLADYCINNTDCLTLAVRKKSRSLGGYLINSQWQKNFWLLA